MKFHGFDSVRTWLNVFKRLNDTQWHVMLQYYHRQSNSDLARTDRITSKTLPYGDIVSDIYNDKPNELAVVRVTRKSPTASEGMHLFSPNFEKYYGDGLRNDVKKSLNEWGYAPGKKTIDLMKYDI